MKSLDCEVVATRSGALAVRDNKTGEVMHPMGPKQEAHDVYIGPSRLEARLREGGAPLVLLDVGLGAGTNALAALRVAESLPDSARRLEIVSFEHDLGALELALEPAHASALGLGEPLSVAYQAASELLAHGSAATPRVAWRLCFGDVLEALAREPAGSADLVFWDMFSSKVHPEVWSARAFGALRRVCRPGATVHTYSAATPTRAALLLGGFAVGVGAATGPRAQTTVAAVDAKDLAEPLGARWLARLARSSSPFPVDVPHGPEARERALGHIRACAQFQTA